jgi:hypothetical protein
MAAMLAEGDALFVEGDYEGAMAQYSESLRADSGGIRVLVHRAIASAALGRHDDALADAERALALDDGCAPAHLRKGIAHFELGDYAAAAAACASAAALDPSRAVKMWLRKANAELLEADGAGAGGATAAAVPAPQFVPAPAAAAPAAAAPGPAPAVADPPQPIAATVRSAGPPRSTTPAALKNVRHEWYQTDSHVVLALFFKKQRREDCTIEFTEREVDISLRLPDSAEFICNLELADAIVPESCSSEVLGTKIELKMLKAAAGVKWPALTDEGLDSDGAGESVPSYPSSNRKKINWDEVDKAAAEELEGEKLEGDAALNKLFKDIYGRADEETRRAMNKSFQTSGGTVLSTNWGEVKEKDYETERQAPKGMEWKSYEPKASK